MSADVTDPVVLSEVEISEVFRGTHPVLGATRLELPKSRVLGVVGVNGAGKSSLFLSLVGALRGGPRRPHGALGKISFLPQVTGTGPPIRCTEFAQRIYRVDLAEMSSSHPRLGLQQYLNERADRLSGGRLRYLAACLAVLARSDTLMLDEPTAFLDVDHRERILQLLASDQALRPRFTFVSSQVPEVVSRIAHRLLIVGDGSVRDAGYERDSASRGHRDSTISETAVLTAIGLGPTPYTW